MQGQKLMQPEEELHFKFTEHMSLLTGVGVGPFLYSMEEEVEAGLSCSACSLLALVTVSWSQWSAARRSVWVRAMSRGTFATDCRQQSRVRTRIRSMLTPILLKCCLFWEQSGNLRLRRAVQLRYYCTLMNTNVSRPNLDTVQKVRSVRASMLQEAFQ